MPHDFDGPSFSRPAFLVAPHVNMERLWRKSMVPREAGLAALLTCHDATLHPEERRSRRLQIQQQR